MLNIDNYWVIDVAGVEVWITETIFNTWVIMGILIVLAIIARIKLKSFKVIPTGFQNVIESIIEVFDNFLIGTMGKKLSYVGSWFFAVFLFVLSSSLLSIFGLRAPTADFITTFGLALTSFVLMVALGFRHRKGDYIKTFFEPNVVFFPMNLIGELAKPISLSFRLFGNVLSGTIILTLYYALTPYLVQIGIPALLHGFFDVVMGFLQTYIFVILSLMYIKTAADD